MSHGPAVRPAGLASDVLLAVALGAVHSVPFVVTGAWSLQLVVVGAFAWRVARARSAARAALLGTAFGSAWLLAGVWWLFVSLHRYGALPAWLSALAVLTLCVLLSLYLGAACAAFARWRRGAPLLDGALFAALWLAAELARGLLFTGFPWLASGYAHVDSPLAALAPWVGVYGIGFVAAWLAAWVAIALDRGRRWHAIGALAVAAGGVGVLGWIGRDGFTEPAGRIGVTLIQPDVPQDQKFDPQRLPAALSWLAGALAGARGPLVIAPETAVPLLPAQLDPAWWASFTAPFRTAGGQRAALVGAPLGSFEAGYTNSAVGIAPGLPDYRYDKHHLVPFGEFIPSGFRWFVDMMDMPLGDFSRGPLAAPSLAVLGQRIAPNICYEDLFGDELAARFRDAERAPTLFANLSNIGWFGDTIAVPQHLHISRMRTLEFERPMLRATNSGATAIIDHRGVVLHSLAPFVRGTLDGSVEGRAGLTPYARWASAFGALPLIALATLVAFAAAARRARRSRI